MQLILKPVSDKRLQEIIITDSRFAIGRNEGQFREYDRSIVEKLSRRHARIFERGGQVFIADLGSSNGTTVNGRDVVGEPLELHLADEVQFGGLVYRVEHLVGEQAGTSHSETSTNAKIVLQPVHAESGLSPIVVSGFPYLMGRYANVFAAQQNANPQRLAQISKKHAHFFLEDGAVHIEDLGSTNGTFVSGERLSEQSRRLVDGDKISFGGDFFAYEIQTFVGRETIADADEGIGKLGEGTIFVDDATNFWDIYMGVDGEVDPKATAVLNEETPSSRSRKLHFLRSVREFMRSSDPFDKRLRWATGLAAGAAAVGLAGYWYIAWPVQQTERLADRGEYRDAAALANRYLESRSSDERLQALATEAILKAFVPEWQARMTAGDFAAASRVLEEARALGAGNPDDDDIFDALDFATRAASVDVDAVRGGALSIEALADDGAAADLVREWDASRTQSTLALQRIAVHVEEFDAFLPDIQSQVRNLRRWESHIAPLMKLRTDLETALGARNIATMAEVIAAFSETHSDTEGLERLDEDRRRFEALEREVAAEQWLAALRLIEDDFHTPPFTDYARRMRTEILPDEATRALYAQAAADWKTGNWTASFDTLRVLAEHPRWGADAVAMLARNSSLLSQYSDLPDDQDTPEFQQRLFALYAELDPDGDTAMRDMLQPQFDEHREAALTEADALLREAAAAWTAYTDAGRLRSAHRVLPQVTDEFEQLAGQLTAAHNFLRRSERIYRQLDDAGALIDWAALNDEVQNEVDSQTAQIARMPYDEAIINRKLGLLPGNAGS